ncbi:hypothetical protein POVCU2_0058560 [Plasmodium ovale curtisi]|uniref:PIR Superfamily Protein n=1 Tax=Plasmodium ovale curtisi TaxID=864141 RepID=A0A1A8WD09_PLAOA|nr:hypothetical protein POVCU2_0058560 [Plasmodium ovale curtisi]SBS98934.1 hypothetical protein POVCU1_049690 [Plasmodium ovale curtisi]
MKYILTRQIRGNNIRDIPCDPTILNGIFPYFNSISITQPAPESGVHTEISSNSGSGGLREILITHSSFPYGILHDEEHRSSAMP